MYSIMLKLRKYDYFTCPGRTFPGPDRTPGRGARATRVRRSPRHVESQGLHASGPQLPAGSNWSTEVRTGISSDSSLQH